MDLLKELNDNSRQFNKICNVIMEQIKIGDVEFDKIHRLGLLELFDVEDDAPGAAPGTMDFEKPDMSGVGKPQAIKSGSGQESQGGRRPKVPVPGDMVVDRNLSGVRIITGQHRDNVTGKDLAANVADLATADPDVLSKFEAKLAAMGRDDVIKEFAKRNVWVIPSFSGQQGAGAVNVADKPAPDAPDWGLK